MYKSIDTPALNNVMISGTLLNLELRDGKTKREGKPYRMLNTTIRVNQFYGGKEETSEIPQSFIANKYKKDNTDNSIYGYYSEYASNYKPAQRFGIDDATKVTISGRNGRLTENMYVSNRNTDAVVSDWAVNAAFLNENRAAGPGQADCASFDVEIFILNMDREVTSQGEETGRLKIRGGIVGWNRKLDCLDFYVENPSAIDFIERNYNINDTAHFVGRIRCTSETEVHHTENSWGESIPQSTTKKKHELIITGPGAGAEDGPNDEERSYNPEDIRILVADRNARKEQKKMEARNAATAKKTNAAIMESAASTKYAWEEGY